VFRDVFNKLKTVFVFLLLPLSLNTTAIGADQAVEQVKSQLTNKAISTTETYINQRANEFINNFGKGRTSIGIKGIESDKPSYSIDTIQPISAFTPDVQELTYIQGSLFSGENEGNRRNTLNLGLGQRYLVEDERAIVGANVFVDYEGSSKHKRASLGLEYQRSNFSATANQYYPISNKKVIGDYTEEALPGYDINLTGQMPYAPWATIKVAHYYWDQTTGDNISGNILGVEIELSPSTSFEFGQEDSNTMNKATYGKLMIKLPLDNNEKATNFVLDDQAFRAKAIMNLTELDMVKRSKQIKIEKILNNVAPVFTSSATANAAENQTSAITLVATDEQTITYSISGTDSALFSVNSSSGVVTFASAPDYESPSDSGSDNVYNFTATATDAKGLATTLAVAITVTDVAEQGVTTSKASMSVGEAGTNTYTLVLDNAPTANVVITPASNNTSSATVSSALTFTTSNWSTPQTVTVTGVNDGNNINESVTVSHSVSSGDSDYNGISVSSVAVTMADDDTAGITQSATSGTINEDGTGTYTVVLDSEPTSDVTVTISSNDTGAATATSPLTFTSSNWSSAQTVTITGVSDSDFTDESVTISHSVSGGGYDAVSMTNYTATITDTVITFAGLTYGLVTSPDTDRVWLDRNLGATQVATSSTDSAAYGYLFQWGRNDDGHESRTSSTTSTLASTITPGTNTFVTIDAVPYDWTTADSSGSSRTSAWTDGGANDVCPSGFSVPTESELTADTTNATTVDVTNGATAFNSFLKLPLAGWRNRHPTETSLLSVGTSGSLWTRNAGSNDARYLTLDDGMGNAAFYSTYRSHGYSIRCIKD
tara:strand:+ start:385 stop:2874 length:2490 start_codon:yes stop_codon:yes gene_type:complete